MTIRDTVAGLLARRQIPADIDPGPDDPFDPVAWRVDTYQAILARETPAEFAGAHPTHPAVLAWAQAHATGAQAEPALLIAGLLGRGKTWQAWGALRHLVMAAAHAGRRCRWRAITHPALNDRLRPKPDDSHAYALDPYLECDLLLLDDLAAGHQTGWTADSLLRLVDHRWSHRLLTVYTTNVAPDQLAGLLDERILSRLRTCRKVGMTGPDRRREGQR